MTRTSTTEQYDTEKEAGALSGRLIVRMFGSLGGYKWLVFSSGIMVCIGAWADMQIIYIASRIINSELWRETGIWKAIAPLLLFCLLNRVFGWLQLVATLVGTNRAVARIRKEFFQHLLQLPKTFFDTHQSGWLTARSTGDIQVLQDFMTYALMMIGMFATITASAWIRISQISPILLIPALFMVPLIIVMTIMYKRRMTTVQRRARDQNSRLVANMAETVRGVRVVHAFGRQHRNLEDFNEINMMSHDTEIHAAKLDAIFMPALDFIGVINTVVVITFAAWLIENPDLPWLRTSLSTGDIVAYVLYMNIIIWPARMMVELYGMAIRAMAAAERIFEVIDMEPSVKDPAKPIPSFAIKGDIEFVKAGFHYPTSRQWIISDFNLHIPAGETVALVGQTGAGKTTLASLVARFYDLQEGVLRIDGHDIRDFRQIDLRSQMGIVLQQGLLFSGTVLDNLRFRYPDMPEAKVIQRCRDLGTHSAIMALSDGYQTMVLEGGESLSLGQRQVLAITRALMADPAILILDEPTSSLDIHTESIIQTALQRLIRNQTTLLIAHRLSTVRHADRILAIKEGRIVEQGTHPELIALDGYYRSLIRHADDSDRDALLETPLT